MPLSREPLPLEPTPRSVQQARHWTSDVVSASGRADLCESAELGVSELVTNALLHAQPPLSVRVRGTHQHPRIEVADGSPELPIAPRSPVSPEHEAGSDGAGSDGAGSDGAGSDGAGPDLEPGLDLSLDLDLDPSDGTGSTSTTEEIMGLSTLGRGLGIVSMCASAWGADIHRDGKIVWFEPVGRDVSGQPATAAIFTRVDDLARLVPEEPLSPVRLEGIPVDLYAGFRQHFSELRRELRLLSLAHASEYPLAANLGTLLTDFEAHLRHADIEGHSGPPAAGSRGRSTGPRASETLDLPLHVPRSTPAIVAQMMDLLDLADAFCHAERLLALARTPTQRQFQRWFLTELVRQADGLAPRRWGGADVDQNAS